MRRREGDQLHIVHVVPRLAFAAQYGVPPVDFVPAAESNTYETAVQRAEQFIIDRFVKAMPPSVRAPVVHIIKVCGWGVGLCSAAQSGWSQPSCQSSLDCLKKLLWKQKHS